MIFMTQLDSDLALRIFNRIHKTVSEIDHDNAVVVINFDVWCAYCASVSIYASTASVIIGGILYKPSVMLDIREYVVTQNLPGEHV